MATLEILELNIWNCTISRLKFEETKLAAFFCWLHAQHARSGDGSDDGTGY